MKIKSSVKPLKLPLIIVQFIIMMELLNIALLVILDIKGFLLPMEIPKFKFLLVLPFKIVLVVDGIIIVQNVHLILLINLLQILTQLIILNAWLQKFKIVFQFLR